VLPASITGNFLTLFSAFRFYLPAELVADGTGSFACRLARSLAFATAFVLQLLQVSFFDCPDMLHFNRPPWH
jgi:hypothetical protein